MAGDRAILLHGFGQDSSVWDAVRSSLGFGCLCPDLRGHGSCAQVRPIDSDSLIEDVLEAARPIAPVLLIGYSMGGRAALRAALAEPALFEGLVLISAGAGIESVSDRAARRQADEALAQLLELGLHDEFDSRWEQAPVWRGTDPAALADARLMRRTADPSGLAAALRGFGQGEVSPVWDRLAELTIPVMLVAGGRDPAYCEIAARMSGAIAGAKVAIVPESGHPVPLESPRSLARLIAEFSRRPRQGGS